MFRRQARIASIVPLMVLLACSAAKKSTSEDMAKKLNLQDVKNLLLAPSGLNAAQLNVLDVDHTPETFINQKRFLADEIPALKNRVYSLNSHGEISEALLAEKISGNVNDPASSDLAFDTSTFAFFRYRDLYQSGPGNAPGKQCVLVGVRKSDGTLSCITANPRCDDVNICNVGDYRSQIKINPQGDTLFLVLGDGGLQKIDLRDPSQPKETVIFTHDSQGDASFPIVNDKNDVMTTINVGGSATNIITKIFGSEGQTYTIPGSNQINRISCAFVGSGSKSSSFYYVDLDPSDSSFHYIELIRGADGSFTPTTLYKEPEGSGVLGSSCTRIVHSGERVFGLNYFVPSNPTFPGNSVLMEYPSIASPILHYALDQRFPVKKDLQQYPNGVVILGATLDGTKSGIEHFDTTTNTATTVLAADDYFIRSMSVAVNGDISFVAVRLADRANILGTITLGSMTQKNVRLSTEPVSILPVR
ncbi:MAG: hypothetical protein FJ146_11095 [Deltaproteobacteria bacterium]|nr:hypothetical protein [Deltaproteobacteria bacterium]